MELTEDEVLQILDLIDKSSFDFVQLQVGDLKLTVSKGGYSGSAALSAASEDPTASGGGAPKASEGEGKAQIPAAGSKPKAPALQEGTVPIKAPMVGTFYITPEPGAPPFVEVGSRVDEDKTVGLIEVMKVFNAVKSGARGTIVEICVQGGQFVEYGQTLLLVKPDGQG
jgi:acetyl-CoA carboxylase biotin carboxyl carrier protein